MESIKEELGSKIDEVTAEDLNLGNVDNTSDMDKPVSNATREAIELATKDMATTEEAEGIDLENVYDPDLSNPVKTYIENRVAELFNAYQNGTYVPDYRVATAERLGVIRSGTEVEVDPVTGTASVPDLVAIKADISVNKANITRVSEAIENNAEVTSELNRNQGDLANLNTVNKNTLVTAINEIFASMSELETRIDELEQPEG